MTRFLMFLFLMLIPSLTIEAKKKPVVGNSHYEDMITFVQEQHLYRGNEGLTAVALNLEWPEVLNHSTSPGLQQYLCTTLFKNDGTSLADGLEKFLRSKGTEITQMPDDPGTVNHINVALYAILWEKNKFISYKYAIKERNSKSANDTIKYGFFTYDIMNDKVLDVKDIFRQRFFPGSYGHETMVDMVLRHMSDTDEFLEKDIPGEAFLMPGGVIIALKDVNRTDGHLSLVSLPLSDAELNYMLMDDTRKLLNSKPEARLAPPGGKRDASDASAPEPGTDPAYIYKVVDEKPDLKHDSLTIDSYMAAHAKYPVYEEYSNITGKVVLQFVVEADGRISHVSSVRPVSPGLASEAVRVLRDTPQWKPATIKGVPVRSLCSVTINFAIK